MDTKKLRQKILDLAIHGKLVPQDPNDEPASVLLKRIKAEKERLIKEGKIKRSKKSAKTSDTPHYENVPFDVPEGWVWTTLGETLELISGQDFPPEKYNANIAGIPYIIGASNIENEQLIINRWTESPSVYSYLNDLLVVCKGAGVGKMAINKIGVAHIARQIQAVRGYTNYTDIKYIKAVVKNNIENIISKANGLIPGLKRELLLSLQLPLPPISEQHRIVYEIERWFSLIDQIEQGKADLQSIIKQAKSKILDLAIHGKLVPQDPNDEPAIELLKRINPDFTPCDNGQYGKIPQGWILAKLGDLFDAVSAKRVLKSEWRTKGVPFYRAREIVKLSEYNKVNNELFIEDKHYDKLKNRYGVPASGDIMLSAVGTIGKCYIVKESDKFYYKDASVLCLKNHHKLSSMYFSMLFSSSFIEEQIKEYSKGTTVDTITLEKLKSYIVPLPPLAEQERIVQKIEELFSVLDNIQNALEV